MPQPWTGTSLPRLEGRTALVTGANAGIGFETAKLLARTGAKVWLGCRNEAKGTEALAAIRAAVPGANVALETMDLASLASVREAATRWLSRGDGLDLLINNAGVMTPPAGKTADGFETQFGVNHLGHYLLTALLWPALEQRAAAGADVRVVSVSSIVHHGGRIDFDNLRLEKPYSAYREYQQSKLATLVFALELNRRLRAVGSPIKSVAAHPGVSATELQRHFSPLVAAIVRWIAMSAAQGALPSVYAGVEPIPGGAYIGPNGFREIWGWPAPGKVDPAAADPTTGTRLFAVSADATGVPLFAPR